jgi:alanyl-tRNA synthetase
MAYRIFADHMRTSTIVFQGVDFDAHGRGYILRNLRDYLLYYMYL